MFRISCVHHQEDHLYKQFCTVCFPYINISSLAGGWMCLRKCTKNMTYKTACTNCLPDDEQMMFEICRRRQEVNYNINLKSVHVLVCVT